ncbi:MAG TPA: prolyl aminopeptidase, partial [Acidimicrobiales bacterium]|nr:prolyl aminopeptidase [Acidimicrobiales bacterium]
GDGQSLYWEACGSPDGTPAVVFHGGPGSGCAPGDRRLFDPAAYRVVLFDQRGCGRSSPRVDAIADLSANTTGQLIADIERLRQHLGIERWVVRGTSWGVTLALAYAQRHPEQVIAMVLASVTMTRPGEIHWLYHEVGRYFPEEWQRFRSGVPGPERDGDLVAAYYRLLHQQPDIRRRERAALDWCEWEDAVSPLPGGLRNRRYDDPVFRMTFARIVTHYFHHRAWLSEDQLLHDAHRLAGIPGVLIHGRFDLGGPVDTAWQLAQVWADAELRVVETGHSGGDDMTACIVEATNRFATLR